MDHEKKFELVKELVDAIAEDCKIDGTVQHIRVLDAIDWLRKEVNRVLFLGKDKQ